jgi:tRNA A37 N6-isopentenylltransferase MiaA
VFELTGRPISSFQDGVGGADPGATGRSWVGLDWNREALNRRINARVKAMITAGGSKKSGSCC